MIYAESSVAYIVSVKGCESRELTLYVGVVGGQL
jgi:hypothetical protein